MSEKPFFERRALERKDVEKPAIDYAYKRGWWHTKVGALTRNSQPDDLFVRNGEYIWWEFKKPGEEPTTQQAKRHNDMREKGMVVHWTDDPNLEDFKRVMR
jgi:hypothetical protein